MQLTHKAIVLMCGYTVVQQIRETDGTQWQGFSSGRRMYNVVNSDNNELSSWNRDEEATCQEFCKWYGLVVDE